MQNEQSKILILLRHLHQIDPEFPIQYAICLFEIARDEGLCMTALAEKTNFPLSTVSRIAASLSDNKKTGKHYGLIKTQSAEYEKRKKQLYLTPQGRKTVDAMTNIVSQWKESA